LNFLSAVEHVEERLELSFVMEHFQSNLGPVMDDDHIKDKYQEDLNDLENQSNGL
jgi:hypothetical protein